MMFFEFSIIICCFAFIKNAPRRKFQRKWFVNSKAVFEVPRTISGYASKVVGLIWWFGFGSSLLFKNMIPISM